MKNYTLKYFVYKTPHSTGGLGELAKAVDLPNIEGKARVWFRCDCKTERYYSTADSGIVCSECKIGFRLTP